MSRYLYRERLNVSISLGKYHLDIQIKYVGISYQALVVHVVTVTRLPQLNKCPFISIFSPKGATIIVAMELLI